MKQTRRTIQHGVNIMHQHRPVGMLSKPEHGWADFSLGNSCYSLSYLSNLPFEWLDRAIFGLEALLPFEVYGYCEPGRMVCSVDFSECHIFYEDDRHRKNCSSDEIVPVNMLEFCQKLYEDIWNYMDDWAEWAASHHVTKEALQARLARLEKLIQVKANCFS